jgi:hypothetical protein
MNADNPEEDAGIDTDSARYRGTSRPTDVGPGIGSARVPRPGEAASRKRTNGDETSAWVLGILVGVPILFLLLLFWLTIFTNGSGWH